jgi:hypothetical protein
MKINHEESHQDFGQQFSVDSQIDGYWGSRDMLVDIVYPFNLDVIKDKNCTDVGSGSGRTLKNLLQFDPKQIISVEPSDAIEVAKKIMPAKETKLIS